MDLFFDRMLLPKNVQKQKKLTQIRQTANQFPISKHWNRYIIIRIVADLTVEGLIVVFSKVDFFFLSQVYLTSHFLDRLLDSNAAHFAFSRRGKL